jgi:hypothetical protein
MSHPDGFLYVTVVCESFNAVPQLAKEADAAAAATASPAAPAPAVPPSPSTGALDVETASTQTLRRPSLALLQSSALSLPTASTSKGSTPGVEIVVSGLKDALDSVRDITFNLSAAAVTSSPPVAEGAVGTDAVAAVPNQVSTDRVRRPAATLTGTTLQEGDSAADSESGATQAGAPVPRVDSGSRGKSSTHSDDQDAFYDCESD